MQGQERGWKGTPRAQHICKGGTQEPEVWVGDGGDEQGTEGTQAWRDTVTRGMICHIKNTLVFSDYDALPM